MAMALLYLAAVLISEDGRGSPRSCEDNEFGSHTAPRRPLPSAIAVSYLRAHGTREEHLLAFGQDPRVFTVLMPIAILASFCRGPLAGPFVGPAAGQFFMTSLIAASLTEASGGRTGERWEAFVRAGIASCTIVTSYIATAPILDRRPGRT
jgi:hypothetical protein